MSDLNTKTAFGRVFLILIVGIAAILGFESVAEKDMSEFKPKPNQPCEGEPIAVDYAYYGGMNSPHGCKPQCEDGKQRYLLYTNGKATQCQKIPGCLDWGEDQGVTCVPPAN